MVLKAVWVTNLPVKCQKLTFSGLKAEFIVLHIMELSWSALSWSGIGALHFQLHTNSYIYIYIPVWSLAKLRKVRTMVAISAHTKNWLDSCHIVQFWDLSLKQNLGVIGRPEQHVLQHWSIPWNNQGRWQVACAEYSSTFKQIFSSIGKWPFMQSYLAFQ